MSAEAGASVTASIGPDPDRSPLAHRSRPSRPMGRHAARPRHPLTRVRGALEKTRGLSNLMSSTSTGGRVPPLRFFVSLQQRYSLSLRNLQSKKKREHPLSFWRSQTIFFPLGIGNDFSSQCSLSHPSKPANTLFFLRHPQPPDQTRLASCCPCLPPSTLGSAARGRPGREHARIQSRLRGHQFMVRFQASSLAALFMPPRRKYAPCRPSREGPGGADGRARKCKCGRDSQQALPRVARTASFCFPILSRLRTFPLSSRFPPCSSLVFFSFPASFLCTRQCSRLGKVSDPPSQLHGGIPHAPASRKRLYPRLRWE